MLLSVDSGHNNDSCEPAKAKKMKRKKKSNFERGIEFVCKEFNNSSQKEME